MNRSELNLQPCYFCKEYKSNNGCITDHIINSLKSLNTFDHVLKRYLQIHKTYEDHFLKALQLINPQYHERFQKLIILK
jgi:hypothetical protein